MPRQSGARPGSTRAVAERRRADRRAGGFKPLRLGTDMVAKFPLVVLGYVQSKGGDASKSLLESALK